MPCRVPLWKKSLIRRIEHRIEEKGEEMRLHYYQCTGCGEKFDFPFAHGSYYLGSELVPSRIHADDLLPVLTRPVWCKDCDILSFVEDIASLQIFEGAYAACKVGKKIDYPMETEGWDREDAIARVRAYLSWRMGRVRGPRALCCGGSNYQPMDVPEPLFKHHGCDFGVVEAQRSFYIGSYCGPGPGVRSPANIPCWNSEGELLGILTWRDVASDVWQVEAASYPLSIAQNDS